MRAPYDGAVEAPLPVVDVGGLIADPYSAGGLRCVDELRDALHLTGAAYLDGTGVAPELVLRMLDLSREIASPDELTPVATRWADEMCRVARWVLRGAALALGQTVDRFDAAVSPEPDIVVAAVRATPATRRARSTPTTGLRQDRDLFTLAHHDDGGGLQVRLGDRLIDVAARPGSCVLLVGVGLQQVSRHYFPATRYRVAGQHAGRDCHIVTCRVNPTGGRSLAPVDLPDPLRRPTGS